MDFSSAANNFRLGVMLLRAALHQAESLAVSRAVRHAKIRQAISHLFLRRAQGVRASAVRLKFPAEDFRLAETSRAIPR